MFLPEYYSEYGAVVVGRYSEWRVYVYRSAGVLRPEYSGVLSTPEYSEYLGSPLLA
jgi:hypothetical protein